MNDKAKDSPGAAAGVPQSDPPDPDDDNKLDPADVAPGLGGTSETRPQSAGEDDTDE
jgi:hypothetical protein